MAAPAFDLQPMSIGDILDRTVRLYRRNFLHTLGIVSIPYLLLLPVNVGLSPARGTPLGPQLLQRPGLIAGASLLGLAAIWLTFVSMGALARSISERYLGGAPTIWASYSPVFRRTFSLIWAYFLSFLVWGGVLMLGVAIPLVVSTLAVLWDPGAWGLGIYALFAVLGLGAIVVVVVTFFRLLLVTQVVVIEGLRGAAALQRSWRLMRRNVWRAVVIFIFGFILSVIVGVVLGVPVGFLAGLSPARESRALEVVVDYLARILATPFLSIPFTLLYYDSRIRQEAFDLEVMARNLGGQGGSAARPAPVSTAGMPVPSPLAPRRPAAAPAAREETIVVPPFPPAPPVAPRGPVGAFKVCPKCGAQVPLVRPACPGCGAQVPFRSS